MKVIKLSITIPICEDQDVGLLEEVTDEIGKLSDEYCREGEGSVVMGEVK